MKKSRKFVNPNPSSNTNTNNADMPSSNGASPYVAKNGAFDKNDVAEYVQVSGEKISEISNTRSWI